MNANDQLKEYNCTEHYYRHYNLQITDGAKALADTFECYWFLDIIASYQSQLKNEEFQVWSLGKNEDSSAVVLYTDGNNRVIKSQKIDYTDFVADEATVWVEDGIALLPSD